MPGRDGTGPLGQGAMTGRGMGINQVNNPLQAGRGGGFGRGAGMRRGHGRGCAQTVGRGFRAHAGCGQGLGRGRGQGYCQPRDLR